MSVGFRPSAASWARRGQRRTAQQGFRFSRRVAQQGFTFSRRVAQQGFSLVELMVVIVVIGLLSTVVIVTMVDPGGRISSDVDRFAGRVRAARDAAIISGRPMALWVSPTGYGFERRLQGQWQSVGEGPLASTDWSSGTSASFPAVSQLRAVFDGVGRADQALDFALARDAQRVRVRVDLDGLVTSGD